MDRIKKTPPKSFSSGFSSAVKSSCFVFFLFALSFGACEAVFAQQQSFVETMPPPLKILSKDEKKQLEAEANLKKRTELALGFMEIRLKNAEQLDDQNQFEKMYEELGNFHALMDYTLNFLNRNSANRKNLNNFKRYEIGLRAFPPRLEVLRRELPIRYEPYLRELLKLIRDTRSKAVEPFFDNTVVPNADNR
jgi:hypothetical protein